MCSLQRPSISTECDEMMYVKNPKTDTKVEQTGHFVVASILDFAVQYFTKQQSS